MTEQERAAALANDIERLGFTAGEGMSFIPTQLFAEVKKLLRRFGATTAMPETPTAPSVVTDDMLDALISALDVRAGYSRDHFATIYSESEKVSARDWYRPALEAALKVKEAPAASSEVRERVAKASKTHALIRTSPKGEMFLGTCTLCGTPNLPMRAAIEPCPNQLGLSQDEALIDVIAATTDDPDQKYDDRDMAEVGRALMAAIETYASTDNPDDPLFRWHPAQCPSEIVGDLIEMVNQARATAVLRTPASDGDREILWRVEQAMIAADRDPEKEVNYAGLARAAISAIRPGDRLPAGVVVPEEPTEALLSEYGKRRGWGLSYKCPFYADDDDQEQCWQVTEVRGGVNDREWYVLGKGETPADAIRAAIAAAKETTR